MKKKILELEESILKYEQKLKTVEENNKKYIKELEFLDIIKEKLYDDILNFNTNKEKCLKNETKINEIKKDIDNAVLELIQKYDELELKYPNFDFYLPDKLRSYIADIKTKLNTLKSPNKFDIDILWIKDNIDDYISVVLYREKNGQIEYVAYEPANRGDNTWYFAESGQSYYDSISFHFNDDYINNYNELFKLFPINDKILEKEVKNLLKKMIVRDDLIGEYNGFFDDHIYDDRNMIDYIEIAGELMAESLGFKHINFN